MTLTNKNEKFFDINTLNKYIVCNSTQFMNHLPEDIEPFIDLIVTSPPYWDMKQYGDVEQTGYKQSYAEYLDDIEQTFKNVYQLSKDTATLYVNSDTLKRDGRLIRLPDDIATRLENVGWIHQDVIIWDKGKTLPWSRKGQMRNTFEYIHMFTKTKKFKYYIDRIKTVDELKEWWIDYPERYSPSGKVPDNIWEYIIPTQGSWGSKKDFGEQEFRHACPFPPEMMARIIKLSTDEGDVVFDPYAGTGILLAMAENLNRKYLGLDTNPEYEQIFKHVTKPLIEEKALSINQYYQYQERLKDTMKETIYKLRILKFPKAIIKSLINVYKQEMPSINSPFLAVIAIKEDIDLKSTNKKFKIGKAKYFFVLNNPSEYVIGTRLILKELMDNAPFSKYGLITSIELVTVEEAINLLQLQNEEANLYSKGVIKNSLSKLTHSEFKILIQNRDIIASHFEKHIPPIFSNLSIKYKDYEMIPAHKYKKLNSHLYK